MQSAWSHRTSIPSIFSSATEVARLAACGSRVPPVFSLACGVRIAVCLSEAWAMGYGDCWHSLFH